MGVGTATVAVAALGLGFVAFLLVGFDTFSSTSLLATGLAFFLLVMTRVVLGLLALVLLFVTAATVLISTRLLCPLARGRLVGLTLLAFLSTFLLPFMFALLTIVVTCSGELQEAG